MPGKKDLPLVRNASFTVFRDGTYHVVSESYFYKTESYYRILSRERAGDPVAPSSRAVLDAYVIPICLERARLAGVPVCDWGISHAFAPHPSIVYGLNYFATSADFFVVREPEEGKAAVRHITNRGKYPFCYQRLDDNARITESTAIFGKTCSGDPVLDERAKQIYEAFKIPLVKMIFAVTDGVCALSSLGPTRYTHLSEPERELLMAYLNNQEFL